MQFLSPHKGWAWGIIRRRRLRNKTGMIGPVGQPQLSLTPGPKLPPSRFGLCHAARRPVPESRKVLQLDKTASGNGEIKPSAVLANATK